MTSSSKRKYQPSNEEQFLIDGIFKDQWNWNLFYQLSIQALISYAIKNGLAALLYTQLNRLNKDEISALKLHYIQSAVRNERLLNDSLEFIASLNANNIPVILLKGAFLSQHIYNDSALRPMSDVDILVKETDIPLVWNKILALGLNKNLQLSDLDPNDQHLPSIQFKSAQIEVHRSLFNKNARYSIPTDDLWLNAKPIQNSSLILQLNNNQHFIYLTLHIYYTYLRGGLRLSWLYDLFLYSNNDKYCIDKEEVMYWIKKWQVNEPFSFCIEILKWLSGNNLPAWLREFSTNNNTKDIFKALSYFKESDQQVNSNSYQLAWEQLFEIRGISKKLRFLYQHIYVDPQHPGKELNLIQKLNRLFRLIRISLIMIFKKIFN